jgi:hypothetical protein
MSHLEFPGGGIPPLWSGHALIDRMQAGGSIQATDLDAARAPNQHDKINADRGAVLHLDRLAMTAPKIELRAQPEIARLYLGAD